MFNAFRDDKHFITFQSYLSIPRLHPFDDLSIGFSLVLVFCVKAKSYLNSPTLPAGGDYVPDRTHPFFAIIGF